MLFNFPLDYSARRVQENLERLELNRTHYLKQLLVHIDINFNREKINVTQKYH